ncbi:MAG: ABC transporter ATP-binding protein [Candidatus Peribacteraceae bacterium]|jgi:ABC-2 type transport system ATP-binding protein|nr:ABC transporter ATP-binding protein [Candidatus Peribacteraceae bacterium]|tara:strand:- start:3590 stop:4528 length:939 start_codon:yes stop_codon:yes gene_type:complete
MEAYQGVEISAKDLLVRYGPTIALDKLSVEISSGIIGLLGPNGAGKSTFIKSLLGLVDPKSGFVKVRGLDPRSDFVKVRDLIGYMPEHDCLINDLNAVRLVSYMGQISGVTSASAIQRAHEVLDFVNLGEERYRKIASYSTGMKQRVKLAQALAHDPPLLLLDEPTNGMDPDGREEMLSLISDIGRTGKTVLLSSHVLDEVQRICGYVTIIYQGRLRGEGSIEDLTRGKEGRFRVEVRGKSNDLKVFRKDLESRYEIVSTQAEGERFEMIIDGLKNRNDLLKLAGIKKVQVRSIRRGRPGLEEAFFETIGDN